MGLGVLCQLSGCLTLTPTQFHPGALLFFLKLQVSSERKKIKIKNNKIKSTAMLPVYRCGKRGAVAHPKSCTSKMAIWDLNLGAVR